MPNPRIVALIGLASAVAAIAPRRTFRFEGVPRLDRPDVYGIAVRPETIWFCATAPRDTHRVSYGFARASRSWTTLAGDRPCATATRKVRTTFVDSLPVSLAGGVRIEVVSPPRDSAGDRHGRSMLRFTDSTRSLAVDLKPAIAAERVARLVDQMGTIDEDTTAILLGGVTQNDSLIWIGLAGGFAEGQGALGGVYRLDRRSGAWEYLVDSTLARHAVTGLAQTRDWLWTGTEHPAEYGPYGRAGLRRLDLRSGEWREFTSSNSLLPDAHILHVAGDERAVAVATEKGLVVIEIRGTGMPREIERWNAQYYVPTFVGDSLVIRIGPKADAPTEDAEWRFMFAQEFARRGQERSVFDQLRKIPLKITRSAVEGSFDAADWRTLANPAYSPVLVSMLSSTNDAKRTAANAVKRLGRRTPAPVRAAARVAFLAIDSSTHPGDQDLRAMESLAAALRSVGDSTGILSAREHLDRTDTTIGPQLESAVRVGFVVAAANIVAEAHDPRGLTLVMAHVGVEPDLDNRLMNALAAFDTPRSWRKLVDIVERRHAGMAGTTDPDHYWREVLRRVTPVAFVESATAARVKDYIRVGLRSPNESSRSATVEAISRGRVAGFGSGLVDLLRDTTFVSHLASTTLVSLYGRPDAPAPTSPATKAAIAWWKKALAAKPALVSRAKGEQALRDWRLRNAGRSERR